jgi:calcium/calmodulin-dependent protein kinase I
MFKSEIAVLKKVYHKNIICLQDLIETKSHYYLIMDLATGGELFEVLLNMGCFTESDAARVVQQLLEALDYLHAMSCVHRDLKPENLLFRDKSPNADIMITDFGLARLTGNSNDLLTTCCGTPFFSDDDDTSNFMLYQNIMKGKYNFPKEYWSEVSHLAKDFISRLLVVDPSKRMTAAEALKHPWLQTTSKVDVLPNVRKNFNAKKTFKKAVLAIQTINKMSASSQRLLAALKESEKTIVSDVAGSADSPKE